MSISTLGQRLGAMGYNGKQRTHGFRASARTMLDEVLNMPVDWIEAQLGHMVRDTNGRAYNRTTHLEQRRDMLQQWADYLDELREQAMAE